MITAERILLAGIMFISSCAAPEESIQQERNVFIRDPNRENTVLIFPRSNPDFDNLNWAIRRACVVTNSSSVPKQENQPGGRRYKVNNLDCLGRADTLRLLRVSE